MALNLGARMGVFCVCMYVSLFVCVCVGGVGVRGQTGVSFLKMLSTLSLAWNCPARPGWLASGPKGLSCCCFSSAGLQPHVTMPGLFFAGGSWVLNPNSHALEGKDFPTEPACDLGSLGNHSSSGTGTGEIPGNGPGLPRHRWLSHQTGLAQLAQEGPWPWVMDTCPGLWKRRPP